MKKLLLVLCFGCFFAGGCGQTSTGTKALPVLDASSPEKLAQSLKTMSASVPVSDKEKFNAYADFYMKWQLPVPEAYEEVAPKLNGKNYKEALAILKEDLAETRDGISGYLSEIAIAGVPISAKEHEELSKIRITNFKYDKNTHVKEMDIENKTDKTISALQVMAREDFEAGPNKKMAMFLIDFEPLAPGQKTHATEKENIAPVQEMLATKVTNGMPVVAIQAFDKDKILIINNDELFTAIDMLGKLRPKVDEMDRLLQL